MTVLDLRSGISRLFGGASGPWRIGAEAELIAISRATREMVPLEGESGVTLLSVLRTIADARGWSEGRRAYGIPAFSVPGGGTLSFEPGGQVELSTLPFTSPSSLLAAVRETIGVLRAEGDRSGIEFLEVGLDPFNPVEKVAFAYDVDRYNRMARHFARIGDDGVRMMKQTASFQVSLDVERDDAFDVWRCLNAIVPIAIAALANSPVYGGRPTGEVSTRAGIWQRVDRSRTGIFSGNDPVGEYLGFALSATSFLDEELAGRSMAEAVAAGHVDDRSWREHLTTLFPEVRPRGHFEFRAADMVDDAARAALLVLLSAVVRSESARCGILEIVGESDVVAYARAPRADAGLLTMAAEAFAVALHAARAEERGFWAQADLEGAAEFVSSVTARGRAPGHLWEALQLRSA